MAFLDENFWNRDYGKGLFRGIIIEGLKNRWHLMWVYQQY
jgi:hypothetical protein